MERDLHSEDEFGSSTGDARENDPSLPGFTNEDERLFRSHTQHAFRFGYEASGDVRFAGKAYDEWQSVRLYARDGFEGGRQIGFSAGGGVIGESPSHERPSFSDPVAGNIDP